MLKFRKSAFKHGISIERIEQVLSDVSKDTVWFDIHTDKRGNLQEMAVGHDYNGIMLEIGVTSIGENLVVFHATRAGFNWRVKHREES